MNPPNNELPPLKNIEASGTFILRLIKPKDDKIHERFKKNAKQYASCRLFFLDGDGNCMTKNFSTEFGKGLAMVIGKLSGKWVNTPSPEMTVEDLYRFCEPAFGRKATFEIEVTPDKVWNDKMQYNYKFKSITSLPTETFGTPASDEAPPF
jgi:hypothetical protein